MAIKNKTAFITGASGTMGWAAFKEIYENRPDITQNVLLRDSEKNRKLFAPYLGDKRVNIIWGDFNNYDSILRSRTRTTSSLSTSVLSLRPVTVPIPSTGVVPVTRSNALFMTTMLFPRSKPRPSSQNPA